MFASLVMGALLLFASEAKSASLFSVRKVPSPDQEGIPVLPIASTNAILSYSTNEIDAIYLVLHIEDPRSSYKFEGRRWSQFANTGFPWNAETSEFSLGETMEQALEEWLTEYYLEALISFNPENPTETYFMVTAIASAYAPEIYDYAAMDPFQSRKVFRLIRNSDGYGIPEETSKTNLRYLPLEREQVDIIVPGLDWARLETEDGETLDTRDNPDIPYNFRGRFGNTSFKSILHFPSRFVGTKIKGKVTLRLLSGAEQRFDLENGQPLPPKPLCVSIRPGRQGEGEVFVTVEGTPTGETVHLQGSTNLTSWEDVAEPISNFNGTSTFRVGSSSLKGFFRAVFHNSLELQRSP